jgi:hypothetical protein
MIPRRPGGTNTWSANDFDRRRARPIVRQRTVIALETCCYGLL